LVLKLISIATPYLSNRLIYSFALIMSCVLCVYGQNVKGKFTADSVFVYQNFKRHGTTAGLRYYHKELDSTNALKIKLSAIDLAELIDIFKNTRRKKLIQQKYGGDICYLIVYEKGQKKRFVVWASPHIGLLDDLDGMKRRVINDAFNRQRLYDLIKNNWQ